MHLSFILYSKNILKNLIKKKIIILNYFFLVLSSFFLTFAIYKSEIINNGLLRSNYIFYYLLFFILTIISLMGIVFKKKRVFILFIIFSFFLNLYSFEIILEKNIIENYLKKKIDKNYDVTSALKIYQNNINNLNSITLAFPSSYYLTNPSKILPLASGQSKTLSYLCNESGKWAYYKSDRFGFRNKDKLWNQEVDIVSVGDSFLHGYCVNEGENISEVFNKKSNYKMLNLGVGGTGPLHQYARLKEYLKSVKKFDYIFWFYHEGNDLANLDLEFNNDILKKYLSENFSQNLIFKQNEIDELTKKDLNKNFLQRAYTLGKFIKLDTIKWSIEVLYNNKFNNDVKNFKVNKKQLEKLNNVLKKVKIMADNYISELVFIYTPYYERYLLNKDQKEQYRLKNEILMLIKNLDLELIDIDQEVFEMYNDPLNLYPFRQENHPNSKGYDLIANHLINTFTKIKNE